MANVGDGEAEGTSGFVLEREESIQSERGGGEANDLGIGLGFKNFWFKSKEQVSLFSTVKSVFDRRLRF